MPCKDKEERVAYNKRWHKEYHQGLREEVLTYYGNGKLACIKCGFSDVRALCIDHIDGTGAQQRRILPMGGWRLCQWLKKQGLPKGYQTLCMNCDFIKAFEKQEFG